MDSGVYQAQAAVEPRVVFWYRLYCGAMAALYVLCFLGGIAILLFREEIAATEPESEIGVLFYGLILIGLGLVLAAAFAASFFLPRARWAWIYHIVMICIGLSSCCTIPVSLPLLIYWIKSETQAWYQS